MSKELLAYDALEIIGNYQVIQNFRNDFATPIKDLFPNCFNIIKQALIEMQKQEKILEIIKERRVDIYCFLRCNTVEEYNDECFCRNDILTQKEFDLLKKEIK